MSANPTWRSLRSISGGYSGCANTWSASITQVTLSSLIRSRRFGIVEGRGDTGGIGDAAGFEQDVFDGFRSREQGVDRLDEVVADLAADAAIGQADHVAVHADDEFGVDVDRAKVVDEHAHAQAVIAGQDAIE